jgi:hypothetical protein
MRPSLALLLCALLALATLPGCVRAPTVQLESLTTRWLLPKGRTLGKSARLVVLPAAQSGSADDQPFVGYVRAVLAKAGYRVVDTLDASQAMLVAQVGPEPVAPGTAPDLDAPKDDWYRALPAPPVATFGAPASASAWHGSLPANQDAPKPLHIRLTVITTDRIARGDLTPAWTGAIATTDAEFSAHGPAMLLTLLSYVGEDAAGPLEIPPRDDRR